MALFVFANATVALLLLLLCQIHGLVENPLDTEGRLNKVDIGLPPKGRIMAVGHFTQEHELDLFIRSEDRLSFSIWTLSASKKRYKKHTEMTVGKTIVSMIASDFNHDGLLDVLVATQESSSSSYSFQLFYQFERELRLADWKIPDSHDQLLSIDWNQDMLIDLFTVKDGRPVIYQAKAERDNGLVSGYSVISGPREMCRLKSPQFSAFADFDGDGLADLMVVCEDGSIEIWRQSIDKGFIKGKSVALQVNGPLTVADVNGDGALDIIYYDEKKNSINIHYNQQSKYCSSRHDESLNCKPTNKLFVFDPKYGFLTDPSVSISVGDLFGKENGWFGGERSAKLVIRDTLKTPISLHAGDFDMDGYPDLLVVYSNHQMTETMAALLKNHHNNHTFSVQLGGTADLKLVKNAEMAAFLPFSPNTRLPDIIVQTSEQEIFAFQNAFFRDTLFLQVQVMSSVCPKGLSKCQELKAATGKPFGAGQPGATFKYNYADNIGVSHIQQGSQQAQSAFQALPLPFIMFGLGRVSNFIEEAQAALSNPHAPLSNRLTHLIPNSRLLLFPPRPPHDHQQWHAELYINPSDYLVYVGATAAGVITVFAVLTAIFKIREIREDNQEKRRAMHAINFDAL